MLAVALLKRGTRPDVAMLAATPSKTAKLPHIRVQMTPGCLQAFGWAQATASWKLCQAAALLLACTLAPLHCTGVEGRSVKASISEAYSVERRLESVVLPAGAANEGWTLGRASYHSPPDTFSKSFKQK